MSLSATGSETAVGSVSTEGVWCSLRSLKRALHRVQQNRRFGWGAFWILLLAQLAPIWLFTYLPTTDGAAHIANADILRKYQAPEFSAFRQYYAISSTPSPNLIGHVLLTGFLYVVPPVVAEKLLVSLYIVLLPLAARYALIGLRRRAAPLAFLVFPFTYSFLFAQGFYNFCLSIGVFLLVVGYWARHRRAFGARQAVVLFALAMLLYTCHLFSLMMACGVIGLLAVIDALRTQHSGLRTLILPALALLPGFVLAVVFRPSGHLPATAAADTSSMRENLISVLQFTTLTSYRKGEMWLGGALVTLILALVAAALLNKLSRRRSSGFDALLIVAAGLLAVYLKAHDAKSMHYYIPPRVMHYLFLMLVLWLATAPLSLRVKRWVPLLSGVIALGFVASHAQKYREFAPQLRDFISAGQSIKPNSTFLPLIFAPTGRNAFGKPSSTDVAPFYMASGYIAVERNAVDLRNYEANTDHFPVRFRPEINPYTHLAVGTGLDQIPPVIDIGNFRARGGQVDYVLIFGMSEGLRNEAGTKALYAHLRETGYEQVPLGNRLTELWKLK